MSDISNSKYWQKRFEQLEEAQLKKGFEYYAELEKQFKASSVAIQQKLEVWYGRLAINNEISMMQAKKLLNADELKEFHWTVEEYIKKGAENEFTQEWTKELENASAKRHISRLENIKMQLQQEVEILYGNMSDGVDQSMREIYKEGYYQTGYEIQKGLNLGWNMDEIDRNKLDKVISQSWTNDGKNFSDRIWTNKEKLVNELNTTLAQSIIRGESPDKAIKTVASRMDVSKRAAANLVMTESAFMASASRKDCFNDLDVEQYEIVATLDLKTSELCRSLDGKVMDMKDYAVGETAPPFHCRCRSTTCPYFADEKGERAARGEDGKTYYVPSDMTYKDWHNKYVMGNPDAELKEKITKNKSTDVAKHKEFTEILGKEKVGTFENFQKLKYNENINWEALNREKITISKINNKSWTDEFKEKAKKTYYEFREKGIEMSDHGIARFLDRGRGKQQSEEFTIDDIVQQLKKPINYKQSDGKMVRYYDGRAVIASGDTKEVITIVKRKNINEDWSEYNE